jgi:hypothetical protein
VSNFKTFGQALTFPLPIDGDWVRIQCGVDGQPNYIFGLEGLEQFYEAGAGIYSRNENGKPQESLRHWIDWYQKERDERIAVSKTIGEIKEILRTGSFVDEEHEERCMYCKIEDAVLDGMCPECYRKHGR